MRAETEVPTEVGALKESEVAMFYRLMKFASSSAYLLLVWLTWNWFQGDLAWEFSLSCLLVSFFWLALTRFQMRQLFTTYFDTFSRLKVLIPVAIGTALAALAVFYTHSTGILIGAAATFIAWTYIYVLYRRNRKDYITKGHGPLPKDTWINPPASALKPGDLILTSGRIATRLHESVGHGEVVVRTETGEMIAFSSYMEKGAIVNPLEKLTSKPEDRGHYVAMRLTTPLTDEELAIMPKLVRIMLKENDRWRNEARKTRDRILSWLPIPGFAKNWLRKRFSVTGYDWLGLFAGRRAPSHWTCIGACLELYARLGVKTNHYGTGMLGLGTGVLDPIMPVRFLSDPAFRILTLDDKREHEAGAGTKS